MKLLNRSELSLDLGVIPEFAITKLSLISQDLVLLIIGFICAVICFYPYMYQSNYAYKLEWLSLTLQSGGFVESLRAGCAISIPLVANLFLDISSSTLTSKINQFFISRCAHILVLLIPNIFIMQYVIPSSDTTLLWCVLNAQNCLGICTIVNDLKNYGSPVWSNKYAILLTITWCLAQIICLLDCTLGVQLSNSARISALALHIISIIGFWWLSIQWFIIIKFPHFSKLIFSERYCYIIYFCTLTIAVISIIIYYSVITTSSSNSPIINEKLLTFYSYLFISCTLVLELIPGRITRFEVFKVEVWSN